MGVKTSKYNTLMAGDIVNRNYEIYKILNLSNNEYLKVIDSKDFNDKYKNYI